MFYPNGEVLAARAAGKAGTGYVLSTLSGTPMEQVRAATKGPAWYQVYLCGGREASINMLEARESGRVSRRSSSRSTRACRACASAICATASKSCSGGGVSGIPYLGQMMAKPGLGGRHDLRRRPHAVSQRPAADRADAVRRCRQNARAVRRLLGRPQMDPRALERQDHGQGRAHGRRCATRG